MGNQAVHERRRGYAICGEARSGSILLCRLLASTGRLGAPSEVFHEKGRAGALLADPQHGLEVIAAATATPNGVYGIKVFSAHFDTVARARWAERLPNLNYVHLTRRDLLGQALSLARAVQTRQYKASDEATATPRYDRKLIADCLARTAYGQARWECWFARNGLQPLRLVYEDVVAAPQIAVGSVAQLISLTEPVPIDWSRVELRPQRDVVTDEWRTRFTRDAGGMDYLDGGRWFSRWHRGPAFARLFLGPR